MRFLPHFVYFFHKHLVNILKTTNFTSKIRQYRIIHRFFNINKIFTKMV